MTKTFCIFSALYYPSIGGVEKYTQHLAHALIGQGYRVIVVTSSTMCAPSWENPCEELSVVRLPCFDFLNGRLPVSRKNKQYRAFFERLLSEPIDYVMINTRFYRHSLEGVRLAEMKGIRPIIVDHGSAHLMLGCAPIDKMIATYEHAITNRLKRHDVRYYAVSQASCEWLRHFGIVSQGILNNSIDAVAFREAASGRDFRAEQALGDGVSIISFVGRFIPEKGIVALLDAADFLQREDVVFLLAGDGPLRTMIEARSLPNVRLLGRLDAPEVADLLLASDAFCLPTRSEGFSTSLLECASCATPPIVTHVGGVDELMPAGDGGFLLERAEASEIVKHVRCLLANKTLGKRMGERLQRRVEADFSWDRTADKVRQACEQANEKRGNRG